MCWLWVNIKILLASHFIDKLYCCWQGVCAAVYAVVHQADEVTQGLVCAKSRIAKRNQTTPRLESIAGHMAVNIVSNVETVLSNYHMETFCWLDSTMALYWIKGKG
jgi:hypothetical protein